MAAPEGTTKVTLHKRDPSDKAQQGAPLEEKKDDPEELSSEDFKSAANQAQEALSSAAQSVQQGTANLLGSLQATVAPKEGEKQDPEVRDFRASAAEAAGQAKAYMQPEGEKSEETK